MPNGIAWTEAFGLLPLDERLRDTWLSLTGDAHTPKTKFGPSSLRIFRPRQAMRLWRGQWAVPRRAVIYNLVNHTPTPIEEGWSVRKTQVRDFRGGSLTYDSHNGTDFAIPLGTELQAPAAARVALVTSEFNRGGLKVVLDHGDGLVTSHAHLGRALVRAGDTVKRGAPFALSGMSGLNGFAFFPWESPHLHMNVYLDGAIVDPFAHPRRGASLWTHADPVPARDGEDDAQHVPDSTWDRDALRAQVEACAHPERRAWLATLEDDALLGPTLVHDCTYYPTRFTRRFPLYARATRSSLRLALPFSPRDVDGITFPS